MNTSKLSDWLQMTAAVGVIAGLGLVAYELRQQHELVRVQLMSEYFFAYQEHSRSFQDEITAAAYAKSLSSPESLTPQEQVILYGLFNEIMSVYLVTPFSLVDSGFFRINPERLGSTGASLIFASEFGHTWWADSRSRWPPPIQEIIDELAVSPDDLPVVGPAQRIKEEMQP